MWKVEKQLSSSYNVFFYNQINFLVIKSAFWTKYFNFDHYGLYSSKCSNSNSCFLCVVSSNGEVKSTKLWSIQDKPKLQENPASRYLTPFCALTLQFTGIFSTILDRCIGLRVMYIKTGYQKNRQKYIHDFQWSNIQKIFHFFICIFPNYVAHEITKEFWKNSHFENMTADFLLRWQNSLR